MGKIMENIKCIYFDLDGTIINSDYKISNENLRAIKYLKSKNIKLGIVTGRSLHTLNEIIDIIQPDLPTIGLNGGMIYYQDKLFEEKFLTLDQSIKIIDIITNYSFDFVIYTKVGIYSNSKTNKIYDRLYNLVQKYPVKYRNFDLEWVKNNHWLKRKNKYKITVPIDSLAEKDLIMDKLKEVDDIEIFCTSKTQIDICPKNVTKGNTLQLVARSKDIYNDEIMVFGDNDNDVSMFQKFHNSVALKNATNKLIKIAKYVTDKECDEDGFSDFIFKHF